MRWAFEGKGKRLLRSNTMPAYTVALFNAGEIARYGASYKGVLLGSPVDSNKAARLICEQHHATHQEAKEID